MWCKAGQLNCKHLSDDGDYCRASAPAEDQLMYCWTTCPCPQKQEELPSVILELTEREAWALFNQLQYPAAACFGMEWIYDEEDEACDEEITPTYNAAVESLAKKINKIKEEWDKQHGKHTCPPPVRRNQ